MMSKAHFILSRSKVIKKYNELKGLANIISYSYKTNPKVGKVLATKTASFFSIHSMEDLIDLPYPERIWFFAQAWDNKEIEVVSKKGIKRFVVDNEIDLLTLLNYIKYRNLKVELLLRLKLKENTLQTGKHFVYGMNSLLVNQYITKLKDNKNIEKLGIHFHRKTQNVSEWSIKDELEDTIEPENWKSIDYVNIGGGIPAEYKNFNSSVLENIFQKIKELKSWLNAKDIKMIIEPGRYISAYSVILEANIKSIYDNNIIIDCSVYNAAMDTFVAHIRLLVDGELDEDSKIGQPYTIKGCTPDSMDIFRYRVYLKNPKVGSKIVFLNAGAYTYSTDFCNLPKLNTVLVD